MIDDYLNIMFFRSMSSEERDAAVDVRSLSSLEAGVLLEIVETSDCINGEYGKHCIATYATTAGDGSRCVGRVRLPEHVMRVIPETPFLALYDGLKEGKNGKTYNDVAVMKPVLDGLPTQEKLRQFADDLRAKGQQAINMKLRIQTLDSFEPGTVFLYRDLEKRKIRSGMEEVVIVSFETEMSGETVTGRMYVPCRCEPDFQKKPNGLLLYRGKRETVNTPGRFYYDISVLDEQILNSI